MKANAMIESKFLKQSDLDYNNGNLVTITKIDQQNVGLADGEEELKYCMHFAEFKKGMVLNSTNIQLTTKALGTDETDDWIGQKIVIYVDDNVSFGGKLVGGIRIRKVKGRAAQEFTIDRQNAEIKAHASRGPQFDPAGDDDSPPF